ncbi:MAG: hypothetical protein K0U19_01355 [Proteobacteria bacterium]|nr:hypothetical protein [Pseudomonadota bacterium]
MKNIIRELNDKGIVDNERRAGEVAKAIVECCNKSCEDCAKKSDIEKIKREMKMLVAQNKITGPNNLYPVLFLIIGFLIAGFSDKGGGVVPISIIIGIVWGVINLVRILKRNKV